MTFICRRQHGCCRRQAGLGMSILPFVVVIALWQFASLFFPRFLFPSLIDVFWRCLDILSSGVLFANVLATVLRILAGLAGAFVIGGALALLMARSPAIDKFICANSHSLPGYSGAFVGCICHHLVPWRGISNFLHHGHDYASGICIPGSWRVARHVQGSDGDGVQFFRPTRAKLFRVMIAPAITTDILTAWKVDLGNASRVVVVAELVGATGGVGYQLLQQQQLFDMAGALAWTLQLVFLVKLFRRL